MNGTRFVVDTGARRPGSGQVLLAGSPLRLFTLGPAGVRVIEAIERGEEPPAGHEPLTTRLVDAGAIHPQPDLVPVDAASLTVVIPAYATAPGSTPRFVPRACTTVVVDDASPCPVEVHGAAVVLRRRHNGGPGAARNDGLAQVTTPFVAFVDADVDVNEHDLLALAAHLADPHVAVVAPRITGHGTGNASVLARYERTRSPLDLGDQPARVAPGTRVSYVPGAVLVCRASAVRDVGGFDPSLRYGEDVDLVWRLHAAGWRCRYEPRIVARHDTRATLRAWVRQRYGYGTSAAPLAARHPGALAPVRMSGWSAATWLPVLAGVPWLGALVAAGTAAALVRKLHSLPAAECVRLTVLGHLHAGRLLAATVTRVWWPVAVLAALVSRRARRLLALSAVVTVASSWNDERPDLDPLRAAALRLLDDAAYGAGVWAGAVAARRADPLLPSLEAWPPKVKPAR